MVMSIGVGGDMDRSIPFQVRTSLQRIVLGRDYNAEDESD